MLTVCEGVECLWLLCQFGHNVCMCYYFWLSVCDVMLWVFKCVVSVLQLVVPSCSELFKLSLYYLLFAVNTGVHRLCGQHSLFSKW